MNYRTYSFRVTGFCIVLAAPSLVFAQTIWINGGIGDWFGAANWTAGVPASTDDTSVNNGGTAVADRSSPLYAADPTTDDLNVGVRTDSTLPPPAATWTSMRAAICRSASSIRLGALQ
jgi:hypothetical protein